LLLLTSSVSADRVFILSRLLAIQQPGNTHGIYRNLFKQIIEKVEMQNNMDSEDYF